MTIIERTAGAPISWGICETPGWGLQLPADRLYLLRFTPNDTGCFDEGGIVFPEPSSKQADSVDASKEG